MTDDFHLFGDPDDGERPVDPDLALMSAYLARELSPLQVLALEERLATDAAFRESMQPLLDAWAAPVASLAGGAAHREPALSELELERSWQRYRREAPSTGSIRPVSPRRISMKRAAAVIALVVVPMASFAQVVMYAAGNPTARGHAMAKRIAAPFARETSASTHGAQLPGGTQTLPGVSRARDVDTGALLPVPTAPVFPLESESVQPSAPGTSPRAVRAPSATAVQGVAAQLQSQPRQPNRARIAELAREHHPALMRGDTTANYVIMVVDASERFLWSTYGSGNYMLEVAGDERTPAERNAYQREHRAELMGSLAGGGGGGGRGGAVAAAVDTSEEMEARRLRLAQRIERIERIAASGGGGGRADSARVATGTAVGVAGGAVVGAATGRGRGGSSAAGRDSTVSGGVGTAEGRRVVLREGTINVRLDSQATSGVAVGRGGRGGGGVAVASGTVIQFDVPEAQSKTYRTGWSSTGNPRALNQAAGLTQSANGDSGIEGLPSASIASADSYVFAAGELAPSLLRILVVHLTPGTVWSPR